jgi:branched-chain amino acid transport system substrate-binding protein
MLKLSKTALVLSGALVCSVSQVSAEPLKVAIIETLSGPNALSGKLILTSIKYGIANLEAQKAWPDGIQLLEYDNQSGPSEAADKLKAAINDGAQVVFQGASSAIAGQITSDIQKHNSRNPGKEILYMNVGGNIMEFTGSKCHFYHFRWNANTEMVFKSQFIAAKEAGNLGKKVYVIGQNYSWGQDVQNYTKELSKSFDYSVVGEVLHDVAKIQDFAPYVAKIKDTNPDSIVTGNWSNDLLLLMKAAGDTGLKARFFTSALDQPGNIANAGDTALGHYIGTTYLPDANGEKTAKFAEDFKAKTGAYPVNLNGQTAFGVMGLGAGLKAMNPKVGDKMDVKKLAYALENIVVDTPMGPTKMRAEDHQALTPMAVAVVSKTAKYKVDNTDNGFQTIKLVSGEQATGPVQSSCKMERPTL